MDVAKILKSLQGVIALGFFCPVVHAASGVGPYYAVPSWDQTLPASTRFVVLTNMNNEAVLDRETGLVWELLPTTTGLIWENAHDHCMQLAVGGRKGWRLPSIQDLQSLVDPTVPSPGPMLPAGHPFTGAQSGTLSFYWTATSQSGAQFVDNFAKSLSLGFGNVSNVGKAQKAFVWCVRGGQGGDAQ
jgi:hypothetical protein